MDAAEGPDWAAWVGDRTLGMISVHDLQGNYLWASPSAKKLLGYEPEAMAEIQKNHASDLVAPEHTIVVYRIRKADGSFVRVKTHSSARMGSNGQKVILAVTRSAGHHAPVVARNY